MKKFLLAFLLACSIVILFPSFVFAQDDILINNCVRKDCDTVNFSPGHSVCIEIWQRPDGSTYEKPGVDTGETCSSSTNCLCTPGTIRPNCVDVAPNFQCAYLKDPDIDWGKARKQKCAPDCQNWIDVGEEYHDEVCLLKFTPKHYSFEKSVGNFNEYTEKGVHSGTRTSGNPIDESDVNNYGAVAALVPAGGPNHELRALFVKDRGNYDVVLADGATKTAKQIWEKCTEKDASPDNWQAYQEKLEKCPEWGFVPTTWRQLASEPAPAVKTLKPYFEEDESPLNLTWNSIIRFFRDIVCRLFGLLCSGSYPLQNPQETAGQPWIANKPNIPEESLYNARLLRQFLLPEAFPTGTLTKIENTYFDEKDPMTQNLLDQTGQTAQQTSAQGGLFRIFQPTGIDAAPAFCLEEVPSPPGGCASDYYYEVFYPPAGGKTITCYTDTPDWDVEGETDWYSLNRVPDDQPLYLRTGMEFFQQGLWPTGL